MARLFHVTRLRPAVGSALLCALLAGGLAVSAGAQFTADSPSSTLRGLVIGTAIDSVYQAVDFQPFWSSQGAVDRLLLAVTQAPDDGLDSLDYNLLEIRRRLAARPDARSARAEAELDVLLTRTFQNLLHDLQYGRADGTSLAPDLELARANAPAEPLYAPLTALEVDSRVASARPSHFLYARLRWALGQYQVLAAAGGWPTVPAGETLREMDVDPRVRALRARLAVSGDLAAADTSSMWFDATLVLAVKNFQRRHDLQPDGAVGPMTLAALNVPVEARIDQLRVNLERTRWVLPSLPESFLAVNVAGFRVFLVRDGAVAWDARAQVGRAARETPIFRANMTHVVLNPTWTVPPTILEEDYYPSILSDSTFLATKGLSVLDNSGKPVSPDSVAWGSYTGKNFPYLLRQGPGDRNALGRIKFMFPNKHFVFLHDTPDKALFNRASRMTSSGCIRVENPFELAELVLNDPEKWPLAKIQKAIASDVTKTVYLKDPLPVYVLYWTADVDLEGHVQFHQDIYARDAGVLALLDRVQRVGDSSNGD